MDEPWNIHTEWEKATTQLQALEYALAEYAAELDSRRESNRLARFVDKMRRMSHDEAKRRLDSTKLSHWNPDSGPFFVEYEDLR